MAKSRKRVQRSKRYLVKLSRSRELIIQKRGRLLRTGEFIKVEKLDQFPDSSGEAWLRAYVALNSKTFATRTLWDCAHALSNLIRNDLGQLVYVEPELNEGQTGLYRDLITKYSGVKNKSEDEGEEETQESGSSEFLDDFDPMSLVPNPMSQFDSLMPGQELLPNQGLGLNAGRRTSHQREQFAPTRKAPSKPDPSNSLTSIETLERKRFVFPLMHAAERWETIDPVIQRMLEVEMTQVYRGAELRAQYPNLESTELPALSVEEKNDILTRLLNQPMSKVLKRYLETFI